MDSQHTNQNRQAVITSKVPSIIFYRLSPTSLNLSLSFIFVFNGWFNTRSQESCPPMTLAQGNPAMLMALQTLQILPHISLVITHSDQKRWKRNGWRMVCSNKLISQNIQLVTVSILRQQIPFRNSTEFYFKSYRNFSVPGISDLGLSFYSQEIHQYLLEARQKQEYKPQVFLKVFTTHMNKTNSSSNQYYMHNF